MNATTCLYTTVRNVSGGTLKFSFLPPHGRELAANGECTFIGGPTEGIRRLGEFGVNKRRLDGFERALTGNKLEIISTPNPVLLDPTLNESKMLKLDNGALYAADPCWLDTSLSSSL